MEEIAPETENPNTLTPRIVETTTFPADSKSFMLTFNVQAAEPKKGKFGVTFLPQQGERAACELQIRLEDRCAQLGPGSLDYFAGTQKSLREGGAPQQAGNYAIENLIGVDPACTVRVIVKGSDKMGGSLIDAEIAGRRTMISYRPELTVRKIIFRPEGVALQHVRIAPLKNE